MGIASIKGYKKTTVGIPLSEAAEVFGVRSGAKIFRDMKIVLGNLGKRYKADLSSVEAIRPDLSIPAFLGLTPEDGLSPIYHLYDRVSGGASYSSLVTRNTARDFRGGALAYDDHDGVDFVCPPGTNLCAAAPGTVVMIRDCWLRGGITVAVDHGGGLITQYTHCWKPLAEIGQQVRRGEPVALSGAAGLDMALFFPWIPPHVHFMSWLNGRPIDPYLRDDEEGGPGTWANRNDPEPAEIDMEEEIPEPSLVDKNAVDDIVAACTGEETKEQLAQAKGDYKQLAAILEDALHHQDWSWPEGYRTRTVRPPMPASDMKISLPLPASVYNGACFSDPKISFKKTLGL